MDSPTPNHLDSLRSYLMDTRVMLVSDQRNRPLEDKLSKHLGLKITWVNSSHARKLQSAKSSIQAGSCKLVLIASAFMGHKVDAVIKGPCKQHGVPFIDVKQGKFDSCIRALVAALLTEGA